MAHLVHNGNFTSETARAAVNKRWDRERAGRNPAAMQKRIVEFFEANNMDPAKSDPNIALAVIMNDPTVSADVRVVAAKTLQPYFHGPPLTEEQMMRLEQDQGGGYSDPVMADKRKEAYEFVLSLISQNSDRVGELEKENELLRSGQPLPPKTDPTSEILEAEEVPDDLKHVPGRSPLSNEVIENE